MHTVIVFLADGFEECEALASVDLLRRAGIHVITASIMGRKEVYAAHQVTILADILAEEADYAAADLIMLPGGGKGTENLAASELVRQQCLLFAQEKQLAAICAAPTILGSLGLLRGKKATCYPGMEEGLLGAEVIKEAVVRDGNIITGRGPGAAFLFALELIAYLKGQEAADQIAKDIVLK